MSWKDLNIQQPSASPSFFPVIVHADCIVCRKQLNMETVAYCVSHPFLCLIHKGCMPFFNYRGGYPHDKPVQFYESQEG